MFKRTSVRLISVFAILCICVASVAACACSHHEISSKAEPLSCHSKSHDEANAGSNAQVPSGDSIGVQCECYTRTIVPAITAKNESKRFKADGADQIDNTTTAWFEIRTVAIAEVISFQFEPPTFYTRTHARLSPPRAPPRL